MYPVSYWNGLWDWVVCVYRLHCGQVLDSRGGVYQLPRRPVLDLRGSVCGVCGGEDIQCWTGAVHKLPCWTGGH